MNLLRMYKRFVIIYIKSKLEYHGALLLELFANTILIGVYFAGFLILFHNFKGIGGWTEYEVLFMFTTSWTSYSVSCFFFWSPMKDIGEMIRNGSFDVYMTRPIGPMTYLVLQQFQYTFLPRIVLSIIFWTISMQKVAIVWNLRNIIFYVVSMLCSFVIFSSITIITGSISFWTIKSEEIVSLLTDNNYGLKNFTDYPIQIYSKGMQLLLTFVVPYAFTAYYPVAIPLGKNIGNNIFGYLSPAIALLFACLACLMWKKGLKHYGSSGA